MKFEEGEVIECPLCHGKKTIDHHPCSACRGDGKMEASYSVYEGAPAGTWFPTRRRGKTGWLICLFGPEKKEMTR